MAKGLVNVFVEREAFAKQLGYQVCCFCAVDRPHAHPKKPAEYSDLSEFWTWLGYLKQPHLQCYLSWPDLGQSQSSIKSLTFWSRLIE